MPKQSCFPNCSEISETIAALTLSGNELTLWSDGKTRAKLSTYARVNSLANEQEYLQSFACDKNTYLDAKMNVASILDSGSPGLTLLKRI